MTVIGQDRPGLVESVADLVASHGGNWLESRMSRLGGQFAGILRVEVPAEKEQALVSELKALSSRGLSVVAHSDQRKAEPPAGRVRVLEIVGQDRPGIVRQISHALASYGGPIPSSELAKHVQLVLTDRSTLSKGKEFGVLSPRTWRLADLGAKHAFLRAGLGWGGMPAELVQSDLARGTLVKIVVADAPPRGFALSMHAVYRTEAPPGIAARWFIERVKQGSKAPAVGKIHRRRSAATKRARNPL